MNQEKIGKFICKLRKEKNMTQKDLADKLNITDRAISKWENGRGLPDLSLIKPLCEELDISINELLSGERLNKKEYNLKLEENIEKTIEYSNSKIKNIKDKIKTFFIIILTIICIIFIDSIQAILFKNSPLIGYRDDYLADMDSYVDRGILVDTYYCVEEDDIVNVLVKFKFSKFDCFVDNEINCPLNPNFEYIEPMDFAESDVMSISIKDGSLTRDGCDIIVYDIGYEKSVFGEEYRIDIFEDGRWKPLEIILNEDIGWNLIGYLVGESGSREMKVNWKRLYGSLENGHYRIVKHVTRDIYNREYFSYEFDIK